MGMPQLKIGSSLNFLTVKEWLDTNIVNNAEGVVRIDFSATEHVDSAGVALILSWLRLCQERGVKLSLENVSEQLHALLKVYELEDMFRN